MIDYVSVIGSYFPAVQVTCIGDPSVYANLVWEGGDPLPEESLLVGKLVDLAKLEKTKQMSEETARRICNGFPSDGLQEGVYYWYDSDIEDQVNLTGSLISILPTPTNPSGGVTPFAVRMYENGVPSVKNYMLHTYDQLNKVVNDGKEFKLYLLSRFNDVRLYLYSSSVTTLEQVEAVSLDMSLET